MPVRIEVAKMDITVARVDAIVNAANEGLQLGAGVAGAIRRRGGRSIQEECDRIGRCPVGQAVVTGAGNLPARWVIHAVGPVWRGGDEGEDVELASAVLAALARADEVGAKSVALPAISTGIYGFPTARAARISVAAARTFALGAKSVKKVLYCLFDQTSCELFKRELEATA
ncbi:MAG TPA: macro domain-containing protein [Thermoanaerobaculia bacterium]|nr:macro domain-containing protein [Thermoanaerobaculia bacterium]